MVVLVEIELCPLQVAALLLLCRCSFIDADAAVRSRCHSQLGGPKYNLHKYVHKYIYTYVCTYIANTYRHEHIRRLSVYACACLVGSLVSIIFCLLCIVHQPHIELHTHTNKFIHKIRLTYTRSKNAVGKQTHTHSS